MKRKPLVAWPFIVFLSIGFIVPWPSLAQDPREPKIFYRLSKNFWENEPFAKKYFDSGEQPEEGWEVGWSEAKRYFPYPAGRKFYSADYKEHKVFENWVTQYRMREDACAGGFNLQAILKENERYSVSFYSQDQVKPRFIDLPEAKPEEKKAALKSLGKELSLQDEKWSVLSRKDLKAYRLETLGLTMVRIGSELDAQTYFVSGEEAVSNGTFLAAVEYGKRKYILLGGVESKFTCWCIGTIELSDGKKYPAGSKSLAGFLRKVIGSIMMIECPC